MAHETNALAQIHRQIMWNRLIAVVEEQAQTMIRTAFSTTVREAGDLSAGIFDLRGRMMAQAVTGTPGHVNSMAESVGHFLRKFPADTMQPGDHYITNDPWLGTGHLHDLTVVTPAFHNDRIVGLFANTAHVIDVGGLGMGPEGRSVFEEGMYVPIVKCFDRGRANETFFDFMRAGSRLPVELEGDIYSLCACNDAGAHRLAEMMDEFEMDSLEPLAAFIFDSSHRATLAEIARIPKGTYRAEISSDGYEEPVTLKAEMTILDDGIEVDYAGTSGLSSRGINVPPAYCRAYSCFGIKCVVAPEIPNNWASLAPFRMKIPDRLHPQRAAPLSGVGAPRDRPSAARPDDGLPAPGGARTCHRRRRLGIVEPAVARRFVGVRSGARQPAGGARLRDHHLQLRRHRRTPDQRWPERHRLSIRCPHHAGGGHRERRADHLLDQGAARRFRRRGTHTRRHRADHGDRRQGRPRIRRQRDLRSHRQRAEGTRRRPERRARRGRAEVRQDAAHQGLSGDPRRRPADPASCPAAPAWAIPPHAIRRWWRATCATAWYRPRMPGRSTGSRSPPMVQSTRPRPGRCAGHSTVGQETPGGLCPPDPPAKAQPLQSIPLGEGFQGLRPGGAGRSPAFPVAASSVTGECHVSGPVPRRAPARPCRPAGGRRACVFRTGRGAARPREAKGRHRHRHVE